MVTFSARKTATSLLSPSSRCLRSKTAIPHIPVLSQRRCLHQEPHPEATVKAAGLSYRPVRRRFVAPFPVKEQAPFAVNENPEKLDAMYKKLLGGDLGLSDEVKWQAVTHKSFDHAWQAFNERLAFFGKRVVLLHTSLSLLNTRPKTFRPPKERTDPPPSPVVEDPNVLKPFRHPDYRYLTYISRKNVREIMDPRKLSRLASMVGMEQVMRWKPAHNRNLILSGQSVVAIDCIYAIVGAVALQKGGDIAGRVVRERILAMIENISW